jgi:putative PIN family toxin of toxin-antitoxin system
VTERIVLDSSVFVSALKSANGASRAVLRLCLQGRCLPLFGQKLMAEYEDLLGRPRLFENSPLSESERKELFDALLSVSGWVPVFFLWRPNLPDEGDNHVLELAVAGAAMTLVTHNVRDFRHGELRFPVPEIMTPAEFLEDWRKRHGDDDDPNA